MSNCVLDQFRDLLKKFPDINTTHFEKASNREKTLTKPQKALGRLEELSAWYAGWAKSYPPCIDHARVAVFAGNHGVVAQGVSAFPASVTAQMVLNFQNGGAAVNQICKCFDSDLMVYEMALETPTKDFTVEPAMTKTECANAIAYGMTAVDNNVDMICIGEMGIGNTTSAAALAYALYGGKPEQWAGPGTGLDQSAVKHKAQMIKQAVTLHRKSNMDCFDWLTHVGGREIAAMVGACIAARMARVPVLLDGYTATIACAILTIIRPDALEHCQIGHLSQEPAHRKILNQIKKEPILDMQMRLGEASGAALALGVLKAALACHNGMASFDEANVDSKN